MVYMIEISVPALWDLLSRAFDEGVAGADAGRVAFPPDVEAGEPDARTRQVLQVSAENDRLRREVAAMHAAIRAVRERYPSVHRDTVLTALIDLLPPEQRDRGDEQPERDEP